LGQSFIHIFAKFA